MGVTIHGDFMVGKLGPSISVEYCFNFMFIIISVTQIFGYTHDLMLATNKLYLHLKKNILPNG